MKRMHIQKTLKVLSVVSLVAILASCASFQPQEEKLPPLRVEYTYWWGDFTILIAQQLGLFEKYNVDVEPVYFEAFSEALPALAAGTIDGGLFAPDDTLRTNAKAPLKVVALYDDGGYRYIVSTPDITSPAELRGKRIGVTIGSVGELIVVRMLDQAGLTLRDVSLINMNVEQLPANLGATVDAGYAWDPYAAEILSKGNNQLLKSGGSDAITPGAIVFSASLVQQRPDDIRAFLKAWFEAVEYRNANPEQANQMIADAMGVSANDITTDSLLFTLQDNRSLLSDQATGEQTLLRQALDTNAEFLIRMGALSKKPVFDELVDTDYLP
jgi:NitT/TauT family transport system substrate-binding protein